MESSHGPLICFAVSIILVLGIWIGRAIEAYRWRKNADSISHIYSKEAFYKVTKKHSVRRQTRNRKLDKEIVEVLRSDNIRRQIYKRKSHDRPDR